MLDDDEYSLFIHNCLPSVFHQNNTMFKLLRSVIGLSAEVGETTNRVQKAVFQAFDVKLAVNNPKMLEELGDSLFYLTLLANTCGYSLTEVAAANREKLEKRYPDGFSVEATTRRE